MRPRIACTARGSTSLFDGASKDVKIHGYRLAFPQHTTYLVVETDDIAHLQTFLRPGAAVTTCEITPVSDKPAPSWPGRRRRRQRYFRRLLPGAVGGKPS